MARRRAVLQTGGPFVIPGVQGTLLKSRHERVLPQEGALPARQGRGCCWLCEELIDFSIGDPNDPRYGTRDHVNPRSEGGSDDLGNLRLAHKSCNEARGRAKEGAKRVRAMASVRRLRGRRDYYLHGEDDRPAMPCM